MADQEGEAFLTSQEFLTKLWECGTCKKKYTGYSIRQHVWECPKGDIIKFKMPEKEIR